MICKYKLSLQFFTSLQPLAMGIFDRKCSQEIRMRFPVLYKPEYNSFGLRIFFLWVGNSILHSILLFWLGRYLVGNGAVWESGRDGGYLVLGNFVYTVSSTDVSFCTFGTWDSFHVFFLSGCSMSSLS